MPVPVSIDGELTVVDVSSETGTIAVSERSRVIVDPESSILRDLKITGNCAEQTDAQINRNIDRFTRMAKEYGWQRGLSWNCASCGGRHARASICSSCGSRSRQCLQLSDAWSPSVTEPRIETAQSAGEKSRVVRKLLNIKRQHFLKRQLPCSWFLRTRHRIDRRHRKRDFPPPDAPMVQLSRSCRAAARTYPQRLHAVPRTTRPVRLDSMTIRH